MSNSKPTMGYWALRGFGQPLRFLAAYLGVDWNERRYGMEDFEKWQKEDKQNLGLDFPNLPYYIDGDFKLTESKAIIKHIAREHGPALIPSDKVGASTCDMVENALTDVWNALLRYLNTADDALKAYLENQIPAKVDNLNRFLKNKKFILGDQITYVDFLLYEMLYHYTAYQADYLDKYPALQQFKKRFEELPAIAKYIASSDYIVAPCINPFAKIKI